MALNFTWDRDIDPDYLRWLQAEHSLELDQIITHYRSLHQPTTTNNNNSDDDVEMSEFSASDGDKEPDEPKQEGDNLDDTGGGLDRSSHPNCSICFEPWRSDGPHRICCIPCGHVYGRSCLEKWLQRCRCSSTGKCPQCNRKFKQKHIINLYAPLVNIPNEDREKELCSLRETNESLQLEKIAEQAKEYSHLLAIVADLQLRFSDQQQVIQMLTRQVPILNENQQGEPSSGPSGRLLEMNRWRSQPTTNGNDPISHDEAIGEVVGITGLGHGTEPGPRHSGNVNVDDEEEAVRRADQAKVTVLELKGMIEALRAQQDAHSVEIGLLLSRQQAQQEANSTKIEELRSQFRSLEEMANTLFSRLSPQ